MTTPRDFRLSPPEETIPCANCGIPSERARLDRLLWCDACVEAGRVIASRAGWGIGAVLALGTAAWIWVAVRPTDLVWGGWAACVVAVLWLGARFGREIVYGVFRARGGPKGTGAAR